MNNFDDDKNLINRFGYFDIDYYIENSSNKSLTNETAMDYYLKQGWKDGESPNRDFDASKLLELDYPKNIDKRNPYLYFLENTQVPVKEKAFSEEKNGIMREIKEGVSLISTRNKLSMTRYLIKSKRFDAQYYYENFSNCFNEQQQFLIKNRNVFGMGMLTNVFCNPVYNYISKGVYLGSDLVKEFNTVEFLKTRRSIIRSGYNPYFSYVAQGGVSEDVVYNKPEFDYESFASEYAEYKNGASIENIEIDEKIDIIIPIYNGYEYLDDLFDSIKAWTDNFRLIVINDCGNDERVLSKLKEKLSMFKTEDVILIENESNLGFVKSVNKASKYVESNFVLLNSDVVVGENWLPRLMKPIVEDKSIATTTPFSNCATYLSYPIRNSDNHISSEEFARYEKEFRKIKYDYTSNELDLPTGVGFCMGVRLEAWNELSGFREEYFSLGYGEENDFCQRCIELGLRNIFVPNLYVYHKHGGSFPSATKKRLCDENIKTVLRLHPSYGEDVSKVIESNIVSKYFNQVVLETVKDYTIVFSSIANEFARDYCEKLVSKRQGNMIVVYEYNGKYLLNIVISGENYKVIIDDIKDLFNSNLASINVCSLKSFSNEIVEKIRNERVDITFTHFETFDGLDDLITEANNVFETRYRIGEIRNNNFAYDVDNTKNVRVGLVCDLGVELEVEFAKEIISSGFANKFIIINKGADSNLDLGVSIFKYYAPEYLNMVLENQMIDFTVMLNTNEKVFNDDLYYLSNTNYNIFAYDIGVQKHQAENTLNINIIDELSANAVVEALNGYYTSFDKYIMPCRIDLDLFNTEFARNALKNNLIDWDDYFKKNSLYRINKFEMDINMIVKRGLITMGIEEYLLTNNVYLNSISIPLLKEEMKQKLIDVENKSNQEILECYVNEYVDKYGEFTKSDITNNRINFDDLQFFDSKEIRFDGTVIIYDDINVGGNYKKIDNLISGKTITINRNQESESDNHYIINDNIGRQANIINCINSENIDEDIIIIFNSSLSEFINYLKRVDDFKTKDHRLGVLSLKTSEGLLMYYSKKLLKNFSLNYNYLQLSNGYCKYSDYTLREEKEFDIDQCVREELINHYNNCGEYTNRYLYINAVEVGGTQMYVERDISNKVDEDGIAYIWNPIENTIKGYDSNANIILMHKLDERDFVDFVNLVKPTEFIISSVVNYVDVVGIKNLLVDAIKKCKCKTTLLIHDFFFICQSYNLIDINGVYCNNTDLEVCNKCQKHNKFFWHHDISISKWRNIWIELLSSVDEITVFAKSGKNIIESYYPSVIENVVVKPHNVEYCKDIEVVDVDYSKDLTLGFVGSISDSKGANVVKELASISPTPLKIIGTYTYENIGNVDVYGKYKLEDLPSILKSEGINVCFVSSIWPETFCYVVDELMATGLPLVSYDIGAQGEKIKLYDKGLVLDINTSFEDQLKRISEFYKKFK